MKFTAQAIAGFLKGEIIGDTDVEVTTVSKIEEGLKKVETKLILHITTVMLEWFTLDRKRILWRRVI